MAGGYAEKTFSLVHECSLIVAHIKPINQLCRHGEATVERKGIILEVSDNRLKNSSDIITKSNITHHLRFNIATTQKCYYTIILPHICALVKFFMKEGVSLEKWIAEVVGLMHIHGISQTELAEKVGVLRPYINKILNGKETPKGAEERIKKALDELIAEKK